MRFKAVTAQEMRELDRVAIEEYGIPGIVLMENAGIRAADSALQMLSARSPEKKLSPATLSPKAVVFCGKGNNGGDGFVIARHLINKGIRCDIYLAAAQKEVKSDALINLNILLKMGQRIEEITAVSIQEPELKNKKIASRFLAVSELLKFRYDKISRVCLDADLIIDALLGTGLSGQVTEPCLSIINLINKAYRPVLAIDTPSGLDVNTGEILGACIKAARTITFGLAKRGFYLRDGPQYTGELIVADISLPRNIL